VIDQPDRFPLWKRFLLGSVTMVLVAAMVSGLWAFSQREDVARIFAKRKISNISPWLDKTQSGAVTILLMGSDHRASDVKGTKPRSDTMMLVRLDPDLSVTSVMSLPRDLKVDIPGYRNNAKLNEAYTAGGPRLALRTIKDLTGLKINHVVNVDFKGFRQAVDRIGCVYMDIDRRYFNSNANKLIGQQYAEINIRPGYQRLCGQKALDFVRYRHEDNDIVRGERQQAFLRQARQQVGVQELFGNAKSLKSIIANNTRTDAKLADGKTLQQVLTLAVRSAGKPIAQVKLPNTEFATIGGGSYVVVPSSSMKKAAERFMEGPPSKERAAPAANEDAQQTQTQPIKRKKQKGVQAAGLVKDRDGGRQQALRATLGTNMNIYYPTLREANAVYQDSRTYKITDPDGKRYSAYRMVARLTNEQGEYYGIQGTTWLKPPILRNPSEERVIRGRTFRLYFEGKRLGLVAWETGKGRKRAVYWISNTLSRSLSTKQMLAIASSLKKLGKSQ
jgi:LCP family protein required for cell wall assembly